MSVCLHHNRVTKQAHKWQAGGFRMSQETEETTQRGQQLHGHEGDELCFEDVAPAAEHRQRRVWSSASRMRDESRSRSRLTSHDPTQIVFTHRGTTINGRDWFAPTETKTRAQQQLLARPTVAQRQPSNTFYQHRLSIVADLTDMGFSPILWTQAFTTGGRLPSSG